MRFAVDASVVVKWCVSENHSEAARLLLGHRLERHAPDFLLVEFANTIWKKARRGEIADPAPYLGEIPELEEAIDLYPSGELVERAARLAVDLGHPVYDCLYLACAEATRSVLITADRRLADRAAVGLQNADVRHIATAAVADEIAAAATALVIPREKIEELVAAHDLLVETDENVRSALYEGRTDLQVFSADDTTRIFDSPAGRRLEILFRELSDEERIDLLALGWLGQGHSGTEWLPIIERAFGSIDLYADDGGRHILGLGVFWRAGYQRLTGISVDRRTDPPPS